MTIKLKLTNRFGIRFLDPLYISPHIHHTFYLHRLVTVGFSNYIFYCTCLHLSFLNVPYAKL